ncbi:host nuclease inhibitor GamL [Raoultella sp. Lac2]|uniref:host nuclease inhibitor GamL n=1 Tax=unclassified Raoultella TaxID=2627600 RepID=UPI00135323FD|nr:host nuclease inhibitor GamL [Raoultella sp. Lac2]MXF99272.1 host nuclease inhibitor GamL [Raoultella sp. Lac1]
MNAYYVQDRIDAQQESVYQARIQREQWIKNRAKEIIEIAPTEPLEFTAGSVSKVLRLAIQSEKCREAYNDFITAIAYDQSEREWEEQYGWAAE